METLGRLVGIATFIYVNCLCATYLFEMTPVHASESLVIILNGVLWTKLLTD